MTTVDPRKAARTETESTWQAFHETIESFYDKGWTDGLPVIPPTQDTVERMLETVHRDPTEALGEVPPRNGVATVEAVAANAVMAGCRPEYFPVVLAAVEAILEEPFNLNGVQATTNAAAPLTIVSGPIVQELNVNSGTNVFGHGYRANATIGRAVRLVMVVIGGGYPETGDKAPLGHPGKFSYCIAESPAIPWEPLHVERGLAPGESGVTVIGVDGPRSFTTAEDLDPAASLQQIAEQITYLSHNVRQGGEFLLVLNPLVAESLHRAGWDKRDMRYFIYERARLTQERFAEVQAVRGVVNPDNKARWPMWMRSLREGDLVPVVRRLEDLVITVAGGTQLPWSAICGGWGNFGGWSVTKPVRRRA